MWKRYQLRPIEQSAGRPDSGIHVFGQDYTDNDRSYDGRSIKRLRNDDPPMLGAVEENEGPALRYVATLRDTGISTPRSRSPDGCLRAHTFYSNILIFCVRKTYTKEKPPAIGFEILPTKRKQYESKQMAVVKGSSSL